MKKLILFIAFVLPSTITYSQYFQTGQDPASINWRHLQTKNFQLIYPDYYEEQAQKLAGKLEAVYPYGSYSLKHNPQKIPVILHTQTVKSNGLVAWAPKRAEFYTTPHQSIYPQDWLEQLAIHEFRHVVQVDKVNNLLPAVVKTILGEQATALVFGGYLPWWLIEGDAVVTETALSNYGRGRFPSFLMEHKAQVVEQGIFSYDKAYLGSYRDFVPNHYKLGYYLVGAARARYGSDLWEEVLYMAGRKPLSVTPLNKVVKKNTGLNKVQLYRSVFDSLKTVWTIADQQYKSPPFKEVSPADNIYTSYRYNHWVNDSVIISLKTSYDEITSFVKIEQNKKEKRIHIPGTIFNESVGFYDEWICWSEQVPDLRWEHSGKSLLRMLNVNTKRKVEIKPEHKSFSPAISPDGKKMVVVEADFSNNYYLSVYNLPGGRLLFRYQSPDNNYFFMPEWLNNSEIAAVILTDKGKRLARIDPVSSSLDILIKRDLGDIKHLKISGNGLYFISSYSGKNSLYRMNLNSNAIVRIYEPRFEAESPAISPDGSKIIISDYTANGLRLIQIPAEHKGIVPLSDVEEGSYKLAGSLAEQESGIPVLSGFETKDYPSEEYSKAANLFNFHSWAPLYIDAGKNEISPGVNLMSQNLLGTAEAVIGYKWQETEKTGRFLLNYSYKGWYPLFDVKMSSGKRASEYNLIRLITDNRGDVIRQDTTSLPFSWGEITAGSDIRLPLNFTKGMFNRFLQPEIQYDFTHYKRNASTPEQFHAGSFHSLGYKLYFHQLLKQSYMDMFPDFGFIVDGIFRHSPAGKLNTGHIAAFQSAIYLPGIMKNHGIKLYGCAQQKKSNGTLGFNDVVRYPRGWGRINTTGIYTGTFDYKMPLFYPDWNIWGILYMQRIKASLFADISRLEGNIYENGEKTGIFKKDISSLGTEMTADVNFLRFYAPSDIGFRASYLPESKNVSYEFLFSIDFTSF